MKCLPCHVPMDATPTGQRCPSCGRGVEWITTHEYQPVAELPLRMPVVDRIARLTVILPAIVHRDERACSVPGCDATFTVTRSDRTRCEACTRAKRSTEKPRDGISPAMLPKDDPKFLEWRDKMRVGRGLVCLGAA